MTEITDAPALASQSSEDGGTRTTARRRPGSGLTAMVLPELQALASSMGISGIARMRKGELIAAIQSHQTPAGGSNGAANGSANGSAEGSASRSTERPARVREPRQGGRRPAERAATDSLVSENPVSEGPVSGGAAERAEIALAA